MEEEFFQLGTVSRSHTSRPSVPRLRASAKSELGPRPSAETRVASWGNDAGEKGNGDERKALGVLVQGTHC